MLDKVNKDVTGILMRGQIPIRDSSQIKKGESPRKLDLSNLEAQKSDVGSAFQGGQGPDGKPQQKAQPVRVEKKVGRNDPCPCGSGKKFKHCHGKVGVAPGV
jgi:preprotein translocase subunit SecA